MWFLIKMKKKSDWTLVIPIWDSPNLVAVALDGLARNSTYSHKIILSYSNIEEIEKFFPVARSIDFGHSGWSPEKPTPNCFDRLKYKNCVDIINSLPFSNYPHEIQVVDNTEQELIMRERLGPLKIEEMILSCYANIGIKMNNGLAQVTTEKVIPFWEDDYYPCPDWDERLMKTIEQFPGYSVYCCTLIRHWLDLTREPYPEHVNDPWEDFREMNCHSLFINVPYPLSRDEWTEACEKLYRQDAYVELCGERRKGFAFPLLLNTSLARQIAPVPENGEDPALYFDSACGSAGLLKVVSKLSLIGNKMPVYYLAEELP